MGGHKGKQQMSHHDSSSPCGNGDVRGKKVTEGDKSINRSFLQKSGKLMEKTFGNLFYIQNTGCLTL